jgi:hypothetical protein
VRRRACRSGGLALACAAGFALVVPGARAASEAELLEKIEGLERRVIQLETRDEDELAQPELERRVEELEADRRESGNASWVDRVRLSGSANTGWYAGEANSPVSHDSFQVWDTRLFVEADLGRDVELAETRLFRDIGFLFEWNLVRLGELKNDVGELYVDFQGIGDSSWANLQVGRFQIPVGENYLRFAQGYRDNPFITNTVGGPWWWDEGLRFYGREGPVGWVASMSDGETPFNTDPNENKQFTLKLYTDPTPWLHVSASGLRSGQMGSSSRSASGALWLGEMWARMFGAGSTLPNYIDGVATPDGPNRLDDSWLAGGDVILHFEDRARIWLGGGWYGIDSSGGSLYDRDLYYWIAEVLLEGAAASPALAPFYLGLRANGLGTYDSGEGYLLDYRQAASVGWNSKSLEAYSMVLGWRITDGVTLRGEYSFRDIDVVSGVDAAIQDNAQSQDVWGIEIGVDF